MEIKKPSNNFRTAKKCFLLEKNGAGEETRTLDSHLGKVMLYQLSYTRSQKAEAQTTEIAALCK